MSNILNEFYEIKKEDLEYYKENGFVCLRNVLPKEYIEKYRSAIQLVSEEVHGKKDNQNRISDYGNYIIQTTNIWRMNEIVREYVFSKRFAKIAADLLEVEGVRLYHDQALIKPARAQYTPWHQDAFYWPLETKNSITMWMTLKDCPRNMGPMIFGKGSHEKREVFFQEEISESSQKVYEEYLNQNQIEQITHDLDAGDVTFHSGYTIHCAQPNETDIHREAMTVIYYDHSSRLKIPENAHQQVDLSVFHPGRNPGDLADSELNPILYKRN